MKYYVRLDIVYPIRYTALKLDFRNEIKDSEMFDSIEQTIECANQIIDNMPKNLLVSEIKNFGKCNDLETYEQCKVIQFTNLMDIHIQIVKTEENSIQQLNDFIKEIIKISE